MSYNILILGASYGSLLGTKMLMAGHNVTLVCRHQTAALINDMKLFCFVDFNLDDGRTVIRLRISNRC